MRPGYKFKVGEEVAHKDNLKLKMFVRRILMQVKELRPKDGLPNHSIESKKSYIVGIECHWWNGDKLEKDKFHSHELVPFHVATAGTKAVLAWIEDIR